MIPKQLNLPFDNSNVDNADLIDYDSTIVAPVQHKI